MKCPRCGACMVYENFYADNEPSCSWKCIFCGEYVDDVVMENRLFHTVKCKRTRGEVKEPVLS
jgi:hypothetical protein